MSEEEALFAATYAWFEQRQWTVFDFQRDAWQAWHAGQSGLIHSPTGSGKTLAAWLGPLQAAAASTAEPDSGTGSAPEPPARPAAETTQVLWITPLRALANDTRESLAGACEALDVDVRVEIRTGDTTSAQRAKQLRTPPFALITTPESLSVLLTYKECRKSLAGVHTVIVDEWHELLGSKRGVQLQLCLARLRDFNPGLIVWGLSATLANLSVARDVLLGPANDGILIRGVVPRAVEIDSVLPATDARFPWAGHMGLVLTEPVAQAIDAARTTLLFTNTRAQSELWFRALLEARPAWFDQLALHHGSIDRKLRETIEARLRAGTLRCVVCTSSLDLGVDFSPVDQVLQVGSPKGVARLMQRAGRSGHRPGAVSRILCVPANAFELVEIAAVRRALAAKQIEGREPPRRCLDVLSQHLVTVALGEGFVEEHMREEVGATHAFSGITDTEWGWVMDFITRGGQALQGYPQYHKVVKVAGIHRVMNQQVGLRHRMSIGTIASNTMMWVAFVGGKRLGSTDEGFIARLKPGDSFQFAGRTLELAMVKDMTAYVRSAKKRSTFVSTWQGTQLPLSSALSDSVLAVLQDWQDGTAGSPEINAIDSMLQLQARWSHMPGPDDFLIEFTHTREGYSVFCYPFAGRLAHEGMALLAASRLSATRPMTFTLSVNDYGFELLSPTRLAADEGALGDLLRKALSADDLLEAIFHSINTDEIAKRRFRDIARIAGLVFDGYPGRNKSAKQVQASSGLIFEVLANHDSENLLLDQARREVLEQQLDFERLDAALTDLRRRQWVIRFPERLTPLSFPLWAENLQSQTQTVSTESWKVRIERMLGTLESAAEQTLSQS